MIDTLLNICIDSIFALCNCLYYLTWPYENVINSVISKYAFLMLLLNAMALLVLNMTPYRNTLEIHVWCLAIATQDSRGFNMKKRCSYAFKRFNVTRFVLLLYSFYIFCEITICRTNHFLSDAKQTT